MLKHCLIFLLLFCLSVTPIKQSAKYLDICNQLSSRKLYLEYEASGILLADSKNQLNSDQYNNETSFANKCTVEFVTCPSCIIEAKFKFLNVSKKCEKSSLLTHCSCDYILLYEPGFKDVSGKQFCGWFKEGNNYSTELKYTSKTRFMTVEFVYHGNYGHAFNLDITARRNRIVFQVYPNSNYLTSLNQTITSPFFPHLYPADLSAEYVIECYSQDPCRINLIFTDFLIAESSILEFFDSNGQRMHILSGNIFRPPIIETLEHTLVIRFYANGFSNYGFKAIYSIILGDLYQMAFKPNTACGGEINNLGGGITMMNMVAKRTKFFDCVWLIKPLTTYFHRKTHLRVKVANFTNFAGITELIIHQGLTSSGPIVEILRYPLSHFIGAKEKEHVVPITQGFYISLRGMFKPESQVAIIYAVFNYKECFPGPDFLCDNSKCISNLLNCDGFDHCGDNSDESVDCLNNVRDHRQFSQIPNFLFPKVAPYGDLTTAALIFLLCSFGLIGIILAMAYILYRINMRERHQRRIQSHIETIHAILEDGLDMEEEIIIPDEPPEYEPPPEYSDVFRYIRNTINCDTKSKSSKPPLAKQLDSKPLSLLHCSLESALHVNNEKIKTIPVASTSQGCQTTLNSKSTSQSPLLSYYPKDDGAKILILMGSTRKSSGKSITEESRSFSEEYLVYAFDDISIRRRLEYAKRSSSAEY